MEKVLRDYRSRLQANTRETERIKMYIRIIAFLRLSVGYNHIDRNRSVPVVGTGARSLVSEERICRLSGPDYS